MPRPRKHRCCPRYRQDRVYKPQGQPLRELGTTELSPDAFEALRLCDGEGLDQAAAGERMGVSRGTVQRLLKQARRDVVNALVARDALIIRLTDTEDDDEALHPHQRCGRCGRRGS